ncbi:MAG TPA: hypothetical protein VFO55_02025 [Gemmatimonadaceae bacterium]|nr:hypothetical protein [Gemmatimonadaceae bacterium]
MTPHREAGKPAQSKRLPGFATGLVRLAIAGRPLALGGLMAVATGCVESVRAVADGPKERATKVEEVSDAIAGRFTNPERSGRFESTRRKLVSGALHPSRVFSDTSLWSATANSSLRSLWALGSLTERGYRFDIAERGPLDQLADTRHVISLRRIGDGEYQWTTGVDFAIGSITARDAAAMFGQLLTAGHDRDASTVRLGARAAFPRSAAVMAKLFSIDSLSFRPGPPGTTTVNMVVGIHTERLARTAPHFAAYVAKYVENSRYRFLVTDKSGAAFFEAVGRDRKLTIRYRTRADGIVTYLGPPRALPDSLRLVSDLTMRVKMFDVGWRNLVTDFTISRGERSRSWLFVARTEPEWDLPLVTARLIRAPLRRPFQGAGSSFEVAVIDSAGGQTVLARRARLEVKESAILRFLSSLVARVFDDLDASVEREEAEFVRELMGAFQQDARAILIR